MINLSEITGTGPNGRIKKRCIAGIGKKNCATSVAEKLALQQEIDLRSEYKELDLEAESKKPMFCRRQRERQGKTQGK